MWIVGSSGMTLFLYANHLKNAILELKKHDQVNTDVGSVYVKIFDYDVNVFSQSIESALSLSFVFFMDQHEKVLRSLARFFLC